MCLILGSSEPLSSQFVHFTHYTTPLWHFNYILDLSTVFISQPLMRIFYLCFSPCFILNIFFWLLIHWITLWMYLQSSGKTLSLSLPKSNHSQLTTTIWYMTKRTSLAILNLRLNLSPEQPKILRSCLFHKLQFSFLWAMRQLPPSPLFYIFDLSICLIP